jgi:hypothetical protein
VLTHAAHGSAQLQLIHVLHVSAHFIWKVVVTCLPCMRPEVRQLLACLDRCCCCYCWLRCLLCRSLRSPRRVGLNLTCCSLPGRRCFTASFTTHTVVSGSEGSLQLSAVPK